jgi:5-formyltetrahydrofolate cyclo-ligase
MAPDEVAAWRRDQRERLLRQRKSLSSAERTALARPMLVNLSTLLETLSFRTLGIYWPIQREIDIRPLADALSGGRAMQLALPVVVRKGAPLEYWRWSLGDPTRPGFWNIPVPEVQKPLQPDVVVAPLVGFQNSFRLGYGGGYFDRTLAAATPRPFAIGLGFEFSRLTGFIAQPHDIPMHAIVTEATRRTPNHAHEAIHGHP